MRTKKLLRDLQKLFGKRVMVSPRRRRSKRSVLSQKSRAKYLLHKEDALTLVLSRLHYFNQHYGFACQQVTIRNQKTRWGSCSKKGNLSFNYRIALIPPHLADYVIVHELCHLAEFNHSSAFWNLVAQTVPKYEECKKELRRVATQLRGNA